ncbi:MAG: leucyl/phenylalanyl-tRNA--protein transferase [Planctomycetia bacterium]|nr:leucyl/phenylalanyl-tRNA--protein transferase [Planctomycetia bacterium]
MPRELSVYSDYIQEESLFFPPAEQWPDNDAILTTTELLPEMFVDAFAHGVLPWPQGRYIRHIPWYSPNPRGIIEWDRFHIPRSLARTIRRNLFEIRYDTSFTEVMRGCAMGHPENDGGDSWITPKMIRTCTRLHEMGFAHSVESWRNGQLVGGVYGIAIRNVFVAESMFYRVPEAGKVALVALRDRLLEKGCEIFDVEVVSANTRRFGATEVPRSEYLRRLHRAVFG